ncbi:hypothetical protein HDU98_000724 [Podochytrium sp. JEL0797]|nr:hypothetical protein HDU98_000724 [Podochytrium sp. JEL0797]
MQPNNNLRVKYYCYVTKSCYISVQRREPEWFTCDICFLPRPKRHPVWRQYLVHNSHIQRPHHRFQTPILSPTILSHGDLFFPKSGLYSSTYFKAAWLVVPGHSRSDAYSLVMDNAVLSDNNVTMPFYSVDLHPEFALAIPLPFLAVFAGLLLFLAAAMKLVALGMRRKQKKVEFEIKYVLFKSAGGLSENFKSTYLWGGEF